jgi:uncharacterized membrane protein
MLKHLQLAIKKAINSFWFWPLGLAISAALLFGLTYYLDGRFAADFLAQYPPPLSIGTAGARQVLATIAGSLITVASLVFSMTLIALTVAAGNIGARLLLRYMQNRSIQLTLGIFLAGFIYALLTLTAIGGQAAYVPRLSVLTAIVIAILCFVWLVFAFHDLAKSIQVDQAIAELSASLCAALKRFQHSEDRARPVRDELPEDIKATSLNAVDGGYVVSINSDGLMDVADQHDLVVRLLVKPGSFVIPGEKLADIGCCNGSAGEPAVWATVIRNSIILSSSRNDLDDPFFCLRLLNEIAARALSPSLNDIYTAMVCVDHVSLGVEYVLKQGLPCNGWENSSGKLRVIYSPYYFDEFVYAAFEQIRHAGMASPALVLRLLDRLKRLSQLAETGLHKRCLDRYLDRVYRSARQALSNQADLTLLESAYTRVQRRDYY